MAIVWGSWVSDRFRCGVELTESPTSVSSSTSSVTVTAKVYIQTKYNGWDSGIDWSLSGSITGSGTKAFDHGGSNEYTLMGTVSKSFSTSYSGPVTVSVTGKVSGWSAYSGTASVTASTSIDKRPIVAPAAPTSFTVTRSSDTTQNLAWARTSTTGAPVTNIDVQRSTNDGTYVQIATLGNVASYSNTSTAANNKYRYRIKTRNSAGSSAWVYSAYISTTPAAPGAPTAAKTTSGDITVTRPALSSVAVSWEVWHAANGVWDASPLATLAAATSVYTHTAPSTTVTHTYRLRAVSSGPTLYSAYSANSNVVQLLTAPSAPTGLAPSGTAADGAEDLVLSWSHNAVDTTAQTAYEVQYRPTGSATWSTTGKITSTSSRRTITADTWANGQVMEWQVRTWGAYSSPSAWSASATVTLSARPSAAINVPDTTYSTSVLTVEWGYDDPELTAQAAYEVQLLKGGTVLETVSGSGTDTSATFARRVLDGSSYTVTVRVQDGSGLWSFLESSDFTVDFAAPPVPSVVAAEWLPELGAVAVTYDTPGPSETEVEATSATLLRGQGRVNVALDADADEEVGQWTTGTSYTERGYVPDGGVGGGSAYRMTGGRDSYAHHAPEGAPIYPGVWTVSVYVRGTGSAQLEVRARDLTVSYAQVLGQVAPIGEDFVRLSVTITAPEEASLMWPIVWQRDAAGGELVVDKLQVEPGPVATPFLAGDERTWAVVAEGLSPSGTVLDPIPPLNAEVLYRVTSVSDLPSSADSHPASVDTPAAAVYVNGGPGFGAVMPLFADPSVTDTTARDRSLVYFAGRSLPVEIAGEQIARTYALKAVLFDDGTTPSRADVRDFVTLSGPACLRDPDGTRAFVSIGDAQVSGIGAGGARELSWGFTEIDWSDTAAE